ncbi:MAG: hypothetical protein HZB25_07745 [Candidatus Eisenbacteria bacterium]|nr:hypothetical protein [Candidatus Eisenbacteria bacterium]
MRPRRCWPVVALLTLTLAAPALAAPAPDSAAAAPNSPLAPGHGSPPASASPHGSMSMPGGARTSGSPHGSGMSGSPHGAGAKGMAGMMRAMAAPPKVAWESLPQADTARALSSEGRTPATSDTTAEVVMDDGGVSFYPDGVVAFLSTRVYLVKSRSGAEALRQLPGIPRGSGGQVTAFVLHDNGSREFGQVNRSGEVIFAGVQPGDLLFISTRVARPAIRNGVRLPFTSAVLLRSLYPVRQIRFWIRSPVDKPAGFRALGLGEPRVGTQAGSITREWIATGLAPLAAEDEAVAPLEGAPVVLVDANPDPDWLAAQCRNWLKAPAGARLKKLAAGIRKEHQGAKARVDAAREYVVRRLAPQENEFAWPDSLARLTPESVLRRGTAGPYGRLVLLSALLRELGQDPGIALVNPARLWRRPPSASPEMARCLVVAPCSKPEVWLNPSSVTVATRRIEPTLQGLDAMVVGPAGAPVDARVPVSAAEGRGKIMLIRGEVDSGGTVTGEMRIRHLGEDADQWRAQLRGASMKAASEVMQAMASQVLFASEILDLHGEGFEDQGDTATMISKFRARDLLDSQADVRWLRLPARLQPELETAPRTTARSLHRLYGTHVERMTLALPGSWVASVPVDTTSGAGACLRWSEHRTVEGGRLVIERTSTVAEAVLPAAQLDAFLEAQKAMNRSFDRPVIFKVSP